MQKEALIISCLQRDGNAGTLVDHVNAFINYSRYSFDHFSVNLEFNGVEGSLPKKIFKNEYKIIVLHYSLFGGTPFKITKKLIDYIKQSSSIKIAYFQDEYQAPKEKYKLINDLDVKLIFSLVREKDFKRTYYRYTNCQKVIYEIPGYVSKDLVRSSKKYSKPFNERKIDFAHRARSHNFIFGKKSNLKSIIGEKFLEHNLDNYNLDISSKESDRIYGDDWLKFLGNTKCILGAESGVSIYDIDGSIKKEHEEYLKKGGDENKLYQNVYEKHEDNLNYSMIPPRVFEAAAFRCLQVLYPGYYSGVIKPGIHYFELKEDHSNLDDLLKLLETQEKVNWIIDNAYHDLILSKRYSYAAMVEKFDFELAIIGIQPKQQKLHKITYPLTFDYFVIPFKTFFLGIFYNIILTLKRNKKLYQSLKSIKKRLGF